MDNVTFAAVIGIAICARATFGALGNRLASCNHGSL